MRYTTTTLLLCFLLTVFSASAWEQKDLLQKEAGVGQLKQSILPAKKWVTYPDYADRAGWDKLTTGLKEELIRQGETYLNYEWNVVPATAYLEFERSGNRNIMQKPFGENNNALAALFLAELAEGKGRFVDQIVNGVWLSCEMTSWALSAHFYGAQSIKTSLPAYQEEVIDLTAGDVASMLAWVHYFLKDELDKVNPLVDQRLVDNLRERIMVPYMERDNYWWQAFHATPKTMVNNWNPWCNSNVLATFLLIEDDQQKLAEAVHRTMVSVDKFINYVNADGACEEGPSYWGHAAGKLFDYLDLLTTATGGEVTLFDEPEIRNLGEYIAKSYIGNGWVVNFADASAKGGGPMGTIFRYGQAVDSDLLKQFAAYLYQRENNPSRLSHGRDVFRTLENLTIFQDLKATTASLDTEASVWYPQTEFCYMRQSNGFFFAGKGGFNNESHNHNDAGTFILYYNNEPVLVDAGVGTYTRQTFSSERYSIWTMQSNYHNLPVINGVPQKYGSKYKASSVKFNAGKRQFSANLEQAYPEEAAVKSWNRAYAFKGKERFSITDRFELKEAKDYNQVNFLTREKPQIDESGLVLIHAKGGDVSLKYDAAGFKPTIERISLDDPRLSKVWGDCLYRLTFTATKLRSKGTYSFVVQPE